MDDMDGALIDSQRVSESIVVDELLAKFKGFKNYRRVLAFAALAGERYYQESLHKDSNQEQLSIPGELALLRVYLNKAFDAYAATFGDPGEKPTMDIMRKICAIALRCMENYGSVERVPPDLSRALPVDPQSTRITGYLNLLRYAPEAITKLDIRFARAKQELLKDITTAPTEDISEVDVSKEPGTPDLKQLDGAGTDRVSEHPADLHEIDGAKPFLHVR